MKLNEPLWFEIPLSQIAKPDYKALSIDSYQELPYEIIKVLTKGFFWDEEVSIESGKVIHQASSVIL